MPFLCYSWRCSVYYSQACILCVYVVAAIPDAALATIVAPSLDAALAAALAAGFAAAPAAAQLCRNG